MAFLISPNLPANVVEIGNEITQAKVDEINAGTLALQSWVSASYLTTSSASTTYAPKASPTFTGTVTIPAGASISGYLTTATASSTYQTQSGMTSYLTTATASSTYQTQAGMSSYLTTASASTTYAPKASPTFTGTVTIPAGASISGYLTTSSASSTYQTQSGMSSYATTSYVTSQGYLTDAPNNANEYVRKGGAWSVATGGGGGGISDAPNDGQQYARKNLAWAVVVGDGAGLSDAPNDGSEYVRKNAAWAVATGGGGGVAWGAITGTVTDQTDLTTYVTGLGYQTAGNVSTAISSALTRTVGSLPYTNLLVSGDEYKVIYLTGGMSGNQVYVPADSTYTFPNGTEIVLVCSDFSSGTHQVSAQYNGSPTINGSGVTPVAITQYVSKLVKVAADTWYYT